VLVEVDFENACFATPLGAMVESQEKDLHRPCRCRQRRRMSVVFLIGGVGCGASSTPLVGLCSSREILAPGSRARDDGGYIATFLEASSWRPLCCWCVFLSPFGWWMSGQRPRTVFDCASRRQPREPWWAVASWGARLTRLNGGDLTFRPGQWPRILVRRPWSYETCEVALLARTLGTYCP
jgi:hypothetical protein